MTKADAALNILRNRIHSFENYGGKEETKIKERLKTIADEKRKVSEMMLRKVDEKTREDCGYSKGYMVPVKSKIGKFNIIFHNYNNTCTSEEQKLVQQREKLSSERQRIGKLLRKKLDDISLKINMFGLDADTTQMLKDFLVELESMET